MLGRIERQKEIRATEDERIRQHHRLNRHQSRQNQEMVKDRAAWHAADHGDAKSPTQLRD